MLRRLSLLLLLVLTACGGGSEPIAGLTPTATATATPAGPRLTARDGIDVFMLTGDWDSVSAFPAEGRELLVLLSLGRRRGFFVENPEGPAIFVATETHFNTIGDRYRAPRAGDVVDVEGTATGPIPDPVDLFDVGRADAARIRRVGGVISADEVRVR